MGKPGKKLKKSGKSPYVRYNKAPYQYSAEYKDNYLDGQGRLCRNGKLVHHKSKLMEAAE